jgi:hypothetical protein
MSFTRTVNGGNTTATWTYTAASVVMNNFLTDAAKCLYLEGVTGGLERGLDPETLTLTQMAALLNDDCQNHYMLKARTYRALKQHSDLSATLVTTDAGRYPF